MKVDLKLWGVAALTVFLMRQTSSTAALGATVSAFVPDILINYSMGSLSFRFPTGIIKAVFLFDKSGEF